jgi:hypothetical protein
MAILKDKGGEIEVRIMKPPFDAAEPDFFDEYANLGVRDARLKECTRYIAPESLTYAIHVTFKKGYSWGKYPRFFFSGYRHCNKAEDNQLSHPKG